MFLKGPFLGGLIFLIHPLAAQGVAYICQRYTSLATLFYLMAIGFYTQSRWSILKNPRWFNHYPQAVCDLYEKVMWVDENPKSKLSSTAYRALRKNILNVRGIMDILKLRRI